MVLEKCVILFSTTCLLLGCRLYFTTAHTTQKIVHTRNANHTYLRKYLCCPQRILLRSKDRMSDQQQQNMTRWAVYTAASLLRRVSASMLNISMYVWVRMLVITASVVCLWTGHACNYTCAGSNAGHACNHTCAGSNAWYLDTRFSRVEWVFEASHLVPFHSSKDWTQCVCLPSRSVNKSMLLVGVCIKSTVAAVLYMCL